MKVDPVPRAVPFAPAPRATRRPIVLHVSCDYPDPIEPFKTKVIKTLVDLTADAFDHKVISLNRIGPRGQALAGVLPGVPVAVEAREFEDGVAMTYAAPGRGLFHQTMLTKLGDRLAAQIRTDPEPPALIVAHKLTIEGIAVRRAAQRLGIPYAVAIQGDTDTKIMSVRRDLAGAFRQILGDAAMVFPFTPWAWDRVREQLGIGNLPHRMLPCPTDIDTPLPPQRGTAGLLSVFHLKNHRRKNLANLVAAMQLLEDDGVAIPALTVIGGGGPADLAACERLIGGSPRVLLGGAMDREAVRRTLNEATAFVLPSLRETFGLVFVEALFAGTPIIYPRGTAVDGYFDGFAFAIAVDARDPRAIAEGIARACRDEVALKEELAAWQASDHARQFMRPAIAATFAEGLHQAIGRAGDAPSG